MIQEPSYHLEGIVHSHDELEDFTGPLDLILMLLAKDKIEIRDIQISQLLDQYLAYLQKMQEMDLEIASEFVQMASHLMFIKTKMLLTEEKEPTELEVLVSALEQLKNRDAIAAVREIAPYVQSKKTDPAVVCIDETGRFVIPLLSGHIGGANVLAEKLAEKLGATAVVTTATDVRGKFSVDAWAARHGCVISDMGLAKAVSAAILEEDIPLCSQFSLPAPLPEGTFAGESGPLGVFIGWRTKAHFARTLRLIPRVLRVGVGCRRGISAEAVVRAVQTVFAENGLDTAAICGVCSIDLKQDEAGLLAACEKNNWPVHFYTAQQLRDVAGDFTPSDFVRSVTGVDNVCERAALLDAEKLIVQKTARDGVTVAVAAEHWEVRFG